MGVGITQGIHVRGCWKKAEYHFVGHVTRGPCFGTRATCQNKATIVTLRISYKLWTCAASKIQLYMKHDETPKIVMSNGTGRSEHHVGNYLQAPNVNFLERAAYASRAHALFNILPSIR